MSPADDTTEIDTSDTKTSKLETALFLTKLSSIGVFTVWGGSVLAQFLGIQNELVGQLFPIVTGNLGVLIGYVIGKQD